MVKWSGLDNHDIPTSQIEKQRFINVGAKTVVK